MSDCMIQPLEQRMLLAGEAMETMVRLPDGFIGQGRQRSGQSVVDVVGEVPGNAGNRTISPGVRALGPAGTGGTGNAGGAPGNSSAGGAAGTGSTDPGTTDDLAPNTPSRARNLGTLSNTRRTIRDSVGRGDRRDYFRFDAAEGQTLDLRFTSSNAALNVELFFDENGDGQLSGTERVATLDAGGSTTRQLEQPLETGTYYVLVSGSGRRSDYTLSFRNLNDDSPGDASDLGTVDGFRSVRDSLSRTDRQDVFSFTLDERTDLVARLTGLSRNADLALFHDADSDGRLEDGELVAESARGGRRAERIEARLDAGDYFAVVNGAGGRETNYRLILSATAASGNVNETDLEDLGTEAIRQTGSLSQGDADVYLFTGGADQRVTFSLSGLSDDADLLLYSGGSAGAFQNANLVASSRNGDDEDEEITVTLADGEYALVVDAQQDTNYVLDITPVTT